jgi:hypothetical protein
MTITYLQRFFVSPPAVAMADFFGDEAPPMPTGGEMPAADGFMMPEGDEGFGAPAEATPLYVPPAGK